MGTRWFQFPSTSGGWRRRVVVLPPLLALVGSQLLFLGASSVAASVSPATASLTISAGSSGTEQKTVGVPAVPPKADIELAIDTTGSMQPSINQAKADALAIVSGVQGVVTDTNFAVVSFKDSADGSAEYQVLQSMTPTASLVQTAINGLSASGGSPDAPEAHNLVFHNSYTPALGGAIDWRTGARKFVIVISDAEPHGAGTAGFAGCTDATADPHGRNTATELAGMQAAERTLMMIRQVSNLTTVTLPCYQSLAAAAFTGGAAVDAGGSLATQIVNLITAAFATVNDVHLEVASASPAPAAASWITFSPASVGPVPAPSTQTFTLTATVPASTPAGSYVFDIVALADGVDIGHQRLTINVTRATTLVYDGDTTQDYHDSTTLGATLTDANSGNPIAGQPVDFGLGTQSCSGTTNASGRATCSIVLNQTPGPYTVTASFAGTAALEPSSDSAPYTITREETTTTYTGPTVIANGVSTTLSGRLLEDGIVPIAGRTLTLTLGTGGSAQSCTGTTDAAGNATCALTPAQPLGPGTVSATFAGDAFYLPSSDQADTILFAFLASGAFVIGNGNAAPVGTDVTFWGAQWSKLNSLSGGAAPNQFKGFAGRTAEPPTCGAPWTTDPGNSTPPPAGPLPAYMGVIVSSSITNSGSTISGNTLRIVVVKTIAGYDSNPGHAGLGTIVAKFC